jgi:uncharacterized membrane protein (UPF0127 family)
MWNRTLKAPAAKTASAPDRKPQIVLGGALLAAIVVALAGMIVYSWRGPETTLLTVGHKDLRLEVADNPQSRTQGLSGRKRLPQDAGLLFVFDEPDEHCFWMKDMRFPIDIVWLDTDKRIVHIRENVDPDTFPKSFCPDQPAQYVLEFNTGTVSELGLSPGQSLAF